jgi:hypothetical protein
VLQVRGRGAKESRPKSKHSVREVLEKTKKSNVPVRGHKIEFGVPGLVQIGAAWPSSDRLGASLAQLDSARLGLTRRGPARPGLGCVGRARLVQLDSTTARLSLAGPTPTNFVSQVRVRPFNRTVTCNNFVWNYEIILAMHMFQT